MTAPRLRDGLVFLPLDDELVVFSEVAQSLFGLNDSAAFVVQKLKGGATPSALVQALVSERHVSTEVAKSWMATALEALAAHGVLDNGEPAKLVEKRPELPQLELLARRAAKMPPYQQLESPVTEKRYRLLNTVVLVRFGHRAQVRLVDAVIGHLSTDERVVPDIVMEMPAVVQNNGHLLSNIYRDGKPIAFAPRLSMLAPLVKAALWQSAVNAFDFAFYLHAGVVGREASCVLLPAPAGSGKSSLTAALVHRGYRYFSDEVALIERGTFLVPPVALANCVKSAAWDLMARYYPMISSLPVHLREDDKLVRYVPPPPGASAQAKMPVSHIVFPRYEAEATTCVRPVARVEALGRLMGECLAMGERLDQANVTELVRWISRIKCFALTFSSLEEAADNIDLIVRASE